ncbi:hydroxymethylbilane synthase [Rubinisphaera italica]|uniref:Porphobilinogen deaminase n=1 Tax=Rubinisphaera italica TaxID=2527969 RepID=A0A5C5XJ02_9PLAN|nr:hydroxymethylbilane synthase [Rubinisphaera italica]TWT63147.1 Porphobilinogen deaminase [Rubinisphaera italica]
MKLIRIATRASQLALWQAHHVSHLLRIGQDDLEVQLVDVTTTGDVDQTQPLSQLGGTGVFTREVQRAVLDGRADIAVHSLKDLPTEILEPELTLAAVPAREQKWDAIVLPTNSEIVIDPEAPFANFPEQARIGTGSLRRQAQLLRLRKDFQLGEIRGNLNTRLKKLDSGEYDAIILATAGLIRLDWEERLSCALQPPHMYPAVGQGALGLECRRDNEDVIELLTHLNDPETVLATLAERAMLATLRAGCHAPVGVDCRLDSDRMELLLTGVVLSKDGRELIEAEAGLPLSADIEEEHKEGAVNLGKSVAQQLLDQGAEEMMGR